MHDIFISYSSKNQNIADAILNILESRKIKCWIAYRDASAGTTYAGSIMKAIKQSKACVLIFSKESNQSKHVLSEIDACINNGVTVIPFKITDEKMDDALEYYLGKTHWLEALTAPLEAHIHRLADQISNMLGIQNDNNAQANPKEKKSPFRMKRLLPKQLKRIKNSILSRLKLLSRKILLSKTQLTLKSHCLKKICLQKKYINPKFFLPHY